MTRNLRPELATASWLALMRAGEQSAAQEFARIVHRLTPGEYINATETVTQMIAGVERHDVLLSECATGRRQIDFPLTTNILAGFEPSSLVHHQAV